MTGPSKKAGGPAEGNTNGSVLPPGLTLESKGRIRCAPCDTYIPDGKASVAMHIKGKKHAKEASKTSKPGKSPKRNARDGNGGGRSADSSGEAAVQNTAPSTSKTASKKNRKRRKSQKEATPQNAPPAVEVEDPSVLEAQKAALRELNIDKDSFLRSVLGEADANGHGTGDGSSDDQSSDDDDDDDGNDAGDNNNGDAPTRQGNGTNEKSSRTGTVESAAGRAGVFEPLVYKRPGGPGEDPYGGMAIETAAYGTTDKLKKVFARKTKANPAGRAEADGEEYIKLGTAISDGNTTPPGSAKKRANDEADVELGTASAADASANNNSNSVGKQSAADATPPWIVNDDAKEAVLYSADPALALHYEILEFSRFVSPTQNEDKARRELVRAIAMIVGELWPSARVEVFGSFATDLHLPSSDIDICVIDTPKRGEADPGIVEHAELAQAIRNVKDFASMVKVVKAKVPLVRLTARESRVKCDISLNRMNGPDNVPVIRKYVDQYPSLRPLLLVIKTFLAQRSLNEPWSGGLGSYSVLLLIVSHLQMRKFNFPGSPADLGSALQQFFILYGRYLNYCMVGIDVKDGMYFNKFDRYHPPPGEVLRYAVQDPNDPDNELGRNSFATSRIRKAFGNASLLLSKWRREDCSGPVTPLSVILHEDDTLVQRRDAMIADRAERNVSSLREMLMAIKPRSPAPVSDDGGGSMNARQAPGTARKSRSAAPQPTEYRGSSSRDPRQRARASGPPSHEPPRKRPRADGYNEYDGEYGSAGRPRQRNADTGAHHAGAPNSYGGFRTTVDSFSGYAPDPTQLGVVGAPSSGPIDGWNVAVSGSNGRQPGGATERNGYGSRSAGSSQQRHVADPRRGRPYGGSQDPRMPGGRGSNSGSWGRNGRDRWRN